jgi:hypothetical protein
MPGLRGTPNQWRVRQTSPESYTSFSTKAIGGGVNLVLGIKNGKSETQSLTFDKDKFKTREEVKAWVKSHDQYHMTDPEDGDVGNEMAENMFCAVFSEISFSDNDNLPWIEILREGTWDYIYPQTGKKTKVIVTEKTIDNMIKNFYDNVRGIYFDEARTIPTLNINIDHKKDVYKGEAVGWFGDLKKDNTTLSNGKVVKSLKMKPISLSEEAQAAIKRDGFKFFSSEFDDWTNPETHKKFQDVLFGGALTNRPYVKELTPISTQFSEQETAEAKKKLHEKEKNKMTIAELKAMLRTGGVTLSEDSTDEFVVDKVADHIKYLGETITDSKKKLTELTDANAKNVKELSEYKSKYEKIELAEKEKAKKEVENFIKDKISPAEMKDPNSIPSKMLSEGRYDELKYFAERIGKGFKETGKKNAEDDDGEDLKGKNHWDAMAEPVKTKLIQKHMKEKEKSFKESNDALKKQYDEAYKAAQVEDKDEDGE